MANPSLNMPLFVAASDVITRMSLDNSLAGITTVVNQGIMAAELHVESVLQGKLSRRSLDCLFFTDAQSFSGIQPNGIFMLEMPNGFLRKDVPVVITVGEGPFDPNFQSIDMSKVRIDYERGYVMVSAGQCDGGNPKWGGLGFDFAQSWLADPGYADKYIRVQCDCGFEPGTNPLVATSQTAWDNTITYTQGQVVAYQGFVYTANQATNAGDLPTGTKWTQNLIPMEQIPEEVYEAIIAYVPTVYDQSQTSNRNQEAQPQYEKAADHSMLLLKPYLRLKGFSFRPIATNAAIAG